MSRLQHISQSGIFRYKTIALALGLAFAGYIIALPPSAPSKTVTLVSTPTNTATFTPTAIQTPFPGYDLTISQSDAPDPVINNHPVTYTLTVTNAPSALGGFACPNVRFGFPSGVQFTFNNAAGSGGYSAVADSSGVTFSGGCLSSQGGVTSTATLAVILTPEVNGTLTSLGSSVVVDPENNWHEDNENNNTAATITTTVTGPTPTSTGTSTSTGTPTNTATITGTATNTPTATATPTASPTPSGIFTQFSSPTYFEDESQNAVITITRTGVLSETTTVNFSTSDGTAYGSPAADTCGYDYRSVTDQSVTFAPNETSKTVTVALCADRLPGEGDETVNLSLTGLNLGSPTTAVLTINDTGTMGVNPARIVINQGATASLYPSTVTPAGAPYVFGSAIVTLYDYSADASAKVDFLLVGPGGQSYILMAGAAPPANGGTVTLNFADTAGQVIPLNGPMIPGDYEPTSYGTVADFPPPAPPGPYNLPGNSIGVFGAPSLVSTFGGTQTRGIWKLYVRENSPAPVGPAAVVGNIDGGWGIDLITTSAQSSISGRVLSANGVGVRNATVTITGNSLNRPIFSTTGSFGYFSAEGLATGETYVVTVSSRRFTFALPSRVITLNANFTDVDFVADSLE